MRSNKRLIAIIAAVVLLVLVVAGGFAALNLTDMQEDLFETDTPITDQAVLEQASEAALEYTGGGEVTGTEVGDEEGAYEIEVTLEDGRQVDVHLDENFVVLSQIDDVEEAEEADEAEDEAEGEDTPITDEQALEAASAAALDYLGEGEVTDTEVGDEEGYYEVEVTLEDGRQVDVHLDENFNVLGDEVDGAGEDD